VAISCETLFLHPRDYSSVDYLAGAEIVVDICQAVGERFGINATARYHSATTPCVVEFWAPSEHSDDALGAALWYLSAGLRGERTTNANCGYGADGVPVPPDAIVSVLSLDELTRRAGQSL
jgi:hypothetical protein